MAKTTFYFSHDYNTRTDIKIKKLIQKHGYVGYGIFWAIVEDLYNNANALPADYASIAYDLREDESLIKSVINDFDLFVINNEIISSESIERRLILMDAKTDAARAAALARWGKERERKRLKDANASNIDANAMQTGCNSNAIKESKVNEIKENDIKKNENKKNIKLPYKFSDIIIELKNSDNYKTECTRILHIDPNKYEEYIDIFAFHNKPIDENEIFDFSETKKHFGHWLQSYLLKSKDITGTTGIKRTASDHIIDKLNTMYTSQHIRLFFEKYMNQNNIDEEKAFKDFEKAKQSGITFAKIQSRITDNKKIFDY